MHTHAGMHTNEHTHAKHESVHPHNYAAMARDYANTQTRTRALTCTDAYDLVAVQEELN